MVFFGNCGVPEPCIKPCTPVRLAQLADTPYVVPCRGCGSLILLAHVFYCIQKTSLCQIIECVIDVALAPTPVHP